MHVHSPSKLSGPFPAGSQYYTSTVRKVNLTSGQVLKEHNLPAQDWGEGLTLLNDT